MFACVGNDEDLRAVVLGDNGAAAGMARGSIFVDHTTASAAVARERLHALQALWWDQQTAFNAAMAGRTMDVLFEKKGRRVGAVVATTARRDHPSPRREDRPPPPAPHAEDPDDARPQGIGGGASEQRAPPLRCHDGNAKAGVEYPDDVPRGEEIPPRGTAQNLHGE